MSCVLSSIFRSKERKKRKKRKREGEVEGEEEEGGSQPDSQDSQKTEVGGAPGRRLNPWGPTCTYIVFLPHSQHHWLLTCINFMD